MILTEALRRWLNDEISNTDRVQAGVARRIGVSSQQLNHLGTCLDANMTSAQLAVIVEEKIRRVPSMWHLSASSAVYAALREYCLR